MTKRFDLFQAIRPFAPGREFTASQAQTIDALADSFRIPRDDAPAAPVVPATSITPRILGEIVGHEGIVPEWYRDSKGVGTWGIGVTNASGHNVDRYKDNPQPIARCLEVYAWLLREKYLPAVLAAFEGRQLTEAQLAAALSFHYNTGAIGRADWVSSWLDGKVDQARAEFMNWRSPPEIVPRREAERELFFDGKWSGDGKATVWAVSKPSYRPVKPQRIDITAELEALA